MQNEQWIVYETTNLLTGKYYVGVHKQNGNPYVFDGYLGSGKYMLNAIKKYGRDNFIRETLYVFDNYIDAFAKEREIVNQSFVANENTYNTVEGGQTPILRGELNGFFGKKHTKKTRQLISLRNKGRRHTKECIARIKKTLHLYWADPEKREVKSKSLLLYYKTHSYPEAAKIKLSKTLSGRKKSEEHKANLSKSKKELWKDESFREKQLKILTSPERCKKLSDSLKGRKKTEEHINKINKNPEKIRKTAEKHRGMKRSAEAKEKMSLAKKGKPPSNKGKRYCYDVNTFEIIMIPKEDETPIGYKNGYGPRKNKKQ